MSEGRVVQILLSGGRSARMGRPKACLPLASKTFLEIGIEAGREAGIRDHVVVVGEHQREIRQAHPDLEEEVNWVIQPDATRPMLDSLKRAVRAILHREFSAFTFCPVDFPLVRGEDYAALLQAWNAGRGESALESFQVFCPIHEGRRGHPVLCHIEVASRILSLAGDESPRNITRGKGVCEVPVSHAGIYQNVNTPELYRTIRSEWEEDDPEAVSG